MFNCIVVQSLTTGSEQRDFKYLVIIVVPIVNKLTINVIAALSHFFLMLNIAILRHNKNNRGT